MGFLDAAWHLLNFFLAPIGLGALTAALVKLVWWRPLRAAPWWRLGAWGAAAAAVAAVVALVVLGREGRMAGYAAMLVACSLAIWWVGPRKAGR